MQLERLKRELAGHDDETKGYEASVGRVQKDIVRLNGLVSKNKGRGSALADTTAALEAEVLARLRQSELGVIELETEMSELHAENDRVLNALVDAERQVSQIKGALSVRLRMLTVHLRR